MRNFSQPGALSLVCDATGAGRAMAADLALGIRIAEEMADVIQSEVAGVVIATPAETHYELARAAIESGKDVFVEKPLALTYEQGARISRSPASIRKKLGTPFEQPRTKSCVGL